MRCFLSVIAVVLLTAGCQTVAPGGMRPASPEATQDFFLVFFRPASAQLTDAAEGIVRQAARNAQSLRAAGLEISVPADAPGKVLTEERFTAIQNILSASGIDVRTLRRASLSAMATQLPGAADRAEIRLVREEPARM